MLAVNGCGPFLSGTPSYPATVLSASHRLLQLLTVLSTRPEWSGAELAGRLGVHERTVRRDVVKLRELGYGVETSTGPFGRTWTVPELALGFTHDAAYVGRLVLAAERTWDIDGDTDAELRHKLAECLWWLFVLADRLDVDLPEAYGATMQRIGDGLRRVVADGAG